MCTPKAHEQPLPSQVYEQLKHLRQGRAFHDRQRRSGCMLPSSMKAVFVPCLRVFTAPRMCCRPYCSLALRAADSADIVELFAPKVAVLYFRLGGLHGDGGAIVRVQ